MNVVEKMEEGVVLIVFEKDRDKLKGPDLFVFLPSTSADSTFCYDLSNTIFIVILFPTLYSWIALFAKTTKMSWSQMRPSIEDL